MSQPFAAFCQDFYINMRLGSTMGLPQNRETVLHFFEQMQRGFPGMTRLRKSETGELNLEEDRSRSSYRWMSLEQKRLCSGHVNPAEISDGLKLHQTLLQIAPHQLGLSVLELEYLDVLLGFDLEFGGNHDEVVAEGLFGNSPLICLGDEDHARPIDLQPSVTFAISEDCRMQARIDVVTRTSSSQVRSGEYADESISVYLVLRRYMGDRPRQPLEEIYGEMTERAEALALSHIIPRVLKPLSSAIASRS